MLQPLPKGKVKASYKVYCGRCGVFRSLSTKLAEKGDVVELEGTGWRRDWEYGWVCPTCSYSVIRNRGF